MKSRNKVMELEYLVNDKSTLDRCHKLIDESDALFTDTQINDNNYVIKASVASDSLDAANQLSDINDKIISLGVKTTLSNGSAAYYNKRLYPVINTFERKLRKLLYAISVVTPEDEGKKSITDLESKDFGQLFDIIFLDADYQKEVKIFVNGKNDGWHGYAGELEAFLNEKHDIPLWDIILTGKVPTLRKSFLRVKAIRNDVMHAHNINRKSYEEAKKLLDVINGELDDTINNLANGAFKPNGFSKAIQEAISKTEDYNNIYDIYGYYNEEFDRYLLSSIIKKLHDKYLLDDINKNKKKE